METNGWFPKDYPANLNHNSSSYTQSLGGKSTRHSLPFSAFAEAQTRHEPLRWVIWEHLGAILAH